MFRKIKKFLISFMAFFLGIGGLTKPVLADSSDKKQIVTTFYPVYYLTNEIAGEAAEVKMLLSNGQDAHHYESTPQDVAMVQEADMFVYQDDEMEYFVPTMLEAVDTQNIKVVKMNEGLDLLDFEGDCGHDHSADADAEADIDQSIEIEGFSDHYHTGDKVNLTAKVDSEFDHYHWFSREGEDGEWETIEGQYSAELTDHEAVDGQEIKAILYDGDHAPVAESAPVKVVIDDHHGEDGHAHDHSEEEHDHEHTEDDHAHDDHSHDHDHAHDHDHGDYDHDHEHAHDHGDHSHTHDHDPHTWLDPKLYAQSAETVRDALVELDPDNAEVYQANADDLIKRLKELDEKFAEGLKDKKGDLLVVQHSAFNYLAHSYGLVQEGITGVFTTQEPGAQQLAQMQDFVKENNVTEIYVDPALDPKIAEAVKGNLDVELRQLRNLEVVTMDEINSGVDYFTIMNDNLKELTR